MQDWYLRKIWESVTRDWCCVVMWCSWAASTRCPPWPDSTNKLSFLTWGTMIIVVIIKQKYNMYSSGKLLLFCPSNNDKGGVLVHFWMVFVVPRLKSPAVCEECVGAIFRDSVHTSMKNRSSVGYLLSLPVDIDSILINGVSPCDHPVCVYQSTYWLLSFCSCSAIRLYIWSR